MPARVPGTSFARGPTRAKKAIAAERRRDTESPDKVPTFSKTATDQARALRGVHARIDPGNVVEKNPPSVPTHRMCIRPKGKSDSGEDLVGKGAHGQERHGNEQKEELIFDLLS